MVFRFTSPRGGSDKSSPSIPSPRKAPYIESAGSLPDRALPALSRDQAATLVTMVRDLLAARGMETTYDGSGALTASGGYFIDLQVLASEPDPGSRRWIRGVKSFTKSWYLAHQDFRALVECPERLMQRVLPYLVAISAVPEWVVEHAPAHALSIPGVVAMPCVPVDDHRFVMQQHDIDAAGGFEELHWAAMENLGAVPPATPVRVSVSPPDEARSALVHVVEGGDPFTASRILLPAQLLGPACHALGPEGVLVAIPHPSVSVAHIPQDKGALTALGALIGVGNSTTIPDGQKLSTDVYYLAPGCAPERITTRVPEGVRVDGGEAFRRCLKGLGFSL